MLANEKIASMARSYEEEFLMNYLGSTHALAGIPALPQHFSR